eukprot:jgi/Mesvir1/12591/Mv02450-RA.1
MAPFAMDDRRKIGIGLTGFGILFTCMGLLFFFDKGLLAMGNILFISGVFLTIGPKPTIMFFLKPRNRKGSVFFSLGFVMVVSGFLHPVFGMAIESYGFVLLFRDFFPTVVMFLKKVPVLGWILSLPGFKAFMNKLAPRGGLPV